MSVPMIIILAKHSHAWISFSSASGALFDIPLLVRAILAKEVITLHKKLICSRQLLSTRVFKR